MEPENESLESAQIFLWIMIGLIFAIALYLVIIYIRLKILLYKTKNKDLIRLQSYPCYLNIILSSAIAIDNLSRLIKTNEGNFLCYCQAFILAIFDKLILTTITVNAYLTYKGLSDNEYYMGNISFFFYLLNSISFFISLGLSITFILGGTDSYENVCYVHADDFKETIDSIVTFILYIVFLFCNIKSLILLIKNVKELSLTNNSPRAHLLHFYRMIASLYISSLLFLVSLLIINDSLFINDNFIDLCYVITCLIIDLFYTMNKIVIKESLKICCCKKEVKEYTFEEDDANSENDIDNRTSDISLDNF